MGGGAAGKLQPQVMDTAGAGLKYLLIPTHQVCNYSIAFMDTLVYIPFSTEYVFFYKRKKKIPCSGFKCYGQWLELDALELTGSGS